jgi:nucleoside-diphosphate-sugar epimerase
LAERRVPFRALVRPKSDTAALRAPGVELSVGDLTDPPSLDRAAPLRSVIVRPAAFQETWLGPATGIWPDKRRAVILGRGRTPVPYVAEDDVVEACVRLATMNDPPESLDFGGPQTLTRHQVIDAFERAVGARFRRIVVPRSVLALGARALRRRQPDLAGALGIALSMDDGYDVDAEPLRSLGIQPRPASDYIAAQAKEAARR